MKQIARNATMDDCGALRDCRYLLHDRDTKFTRSFRAILVSGRVKPLALPARSPNLNAYAERWVRSVKEECLSKVILFAGFYATIIARRRDGASSDQYYGPYGRETKTAVLRVGAVGRPHRKMAQLLGFSSSPGAPGDSCPGR